MSCNCGCKKCKGEEGISGKFLSETKKILNSEIFTAPTNPIRRKLKNRGARKKCRGLRRAIGLCKDKNRDGYEDEITETKPATQKEEREKREDKSISEGVAPTDKPTEASSTRKKNIRCEFRRETLYEGIRLTSAGRNIENQIATAYLPKYPKCYRKAAMGFFGGDKCQEGIFWHRVTDAQHKAEMREDAKNMNCDNNETKGAESFGAFDPVNDFLPRYRYPANSAWSPAYNPAAPYRQADQQAIAVYPCNYDSGTRVRGV